MINTDKMNPIFAANRLGAWSIGLLDILNCLTMVSLKRFNTLYLPKLKPRKKKSTARNTVIPNDMVNREMVTRRYTHSAVSLTLFSFTCIKSTGHSFSMLYL